MTLYKIKPRFQALLRPFVATLAHHGISANQVTLFAACGSVLLGAVLSLKAQQQPGYFLLLPLWMFIRMALNAIDGMLAREHQQQSLLGAYLNELADVVADAALFIPFALVAPFSWFSVALVIFLATVSEFAGVMGLTVGAERRYDGPMGKSDRALVFGALGLWLGLSGQLPEWIAMIIPLLSFLLFVTIFNRTNRALSSVK